jgi:aminoglycoside phosphotransferase (APT) family kinase protein
MARQYGFMRLAGERAGVPVPPLVRLEEDPAALGAQAILMGRVEGRVPPDVMPYTYGGNWLFDATAAEQRALQTATVRTLARVHEVGAAEVLRAGLAEPCQGSRLRAHVEAQREYYAWVVAGRQRSPLIERAFAKLEEWWPAQEGPAVLSWGDARPGNVIYQGFAPAAVLDWEMAGVAPREVDLGWLVYLHRFFQDLTEGSGLPGMPGFLEREAVVGQYAADSGYPARDMDFYTLYAALRHAVVMLRIAYRQVRFGELAQAVDVDAMILHRASLEAMVEGTYWPAVRRP